MNVAILFFVFLFCGLVSAQDDVNVTDTEINGQRQLLCMQSGTCDLLMKFGAMEENLKAIETRLEDSETSLRESKTRITKSENQILELKNKASKKVIFSAAVGQAGTLGPFNVHTTLVYTRVITNVGSAYSPATGIFTAPVAGVYYFSIFYHAGGAYEGFLMLYKNDQLMVITHDHKSSSDTADNGGNAVFLQLQQGDQVYVKLAANAHVWGNGRHTTFSGFLVTQM